MMDEHNRLQPKPSDIYHWVITALCIAVAVGACLTLVSFFLLDFLFIFAFFLSILLVRTAYRAGVPPHISNRFVVTPWTYLIAFGSSWIAALCAAGLREGLCYVITDARMLRPGLFQHLECGKQLTEATLFGASFFLLLPTMLFSWWFWYHGRAKNDELSS